MARRAPAHSPPAKKQHFAAHPLARPESHPWDTPCLHACSRGIFVGHGGGWCSIWPNCLKPSSPSAQELCWPWMMMMLPGLALCIGGVFAISFRRESRIAARASEQVPAEVHRSRQKNCFSLRDLLPSGGENRGGRESRCDSPARRREFNVTRQTKTPTVDAGSGGPRYDIRASLYYQLSSRPMAEDPPLPPSVFFLWSLSCLHTRLENRDASR